MLAEREAMTTQINENGQRYPYLHLPEKGFVFVATYGRSGSTLLMKLLNSIQGACVRGESGNSLTPVLSSIYSLKSNYNVNIRRTELRKDPEDRTPHWQKILGTVDDPWYGAENIDVTGYANSVLDSFVRYILCPPQQVSFLGFKDIHFHESGAQFEPIMSCLLEFFPNSKIIFLTRDLEDVSSSGWWKTIEKAAVVKNLGKANDLFHTFHETNKDRTMMFDYGEYSDRENGVRRIFDFLGAEFDRKKVDEIMDVRLNHLK